MTPMRCVQLRVSLAAFTHDDSLKHGLRLLCALSHLEVCVCNFIRAQHPLRLMHLSDEVLFSTG
jgi:hypothetical protein